MSNMITLAYISLIAASALFIVLAVFLHFICVELETIGGMKKSGYGLPASFLSRIRLGVRAIEVQTGGLAPEVIKLNGGLTAVRDGLGAIDANLDGVITAVLAQKT
ncbi:MAG: hypothetical protein ABI681_05070 [Gemmatimonadales bacterium]